MRATGLGKSQLRTDQPVEDKGLTATISEESVFTVIILSYDFRTTVATMKVQRPMTSKAAAVNSLVFTVSGAEGRYSMGHDGYVKISDIKADGFSSANFSLR